MSHPTGSQPSDSQPSDSQPSDDQPSAGGRTPAGERTRRRFGAWFGGLDQPQQVLLVGTLIAALIACGGSIGAAVVTGGFGLITKSGDGSAGAAPPATTVTSAPQPTPTPTATRSRTIHGSEVTSRPEPPPTDPIPSPTVIRTRTAFSFSGPPVVPNCSTLTGTGEQPSSGVAVLFVQFGNEAKYYYEQPLDFDRAARTWRIDRVVIGGSEDAGKRFHLHAYVVTAAYAADLAKHDGTPYFVTSPPGRTLGSTVVTRDDQLGNC